MTAARNLIEIRNLSVHRQGICILNGIDLDLQAGRLHSVIGPNGAGKTTLIQCLLGSMPHRGEIRVRLRDKRSIGYVPQHLEFDHAAPMSVGDFLSLMLQKSALPLGRSKKTRKLAAELLSLTHMEHLMERRLGHLSGGELQRVLLAQALHPKPEVLLLDEPASHIDEKGAREFEQLLRRLSRQDGITILMVSHHLASTLAISDRVSVINRDLVFSGEARAFADSEACFRLFGHRPYLDAATYPEAVPGQTLKACEGR